MSVFLPAWLSFSDLKALENDKSTSDETSSHQTMNESEKQQSNIAQVIDPCDPYKKNVGLSSKGLRHRSKKK